MLEILAELEYCQIVLQDHLLLGGFIDGLVNPAWISTFELLFCLCCLYYLAFALFVTFVLFVCVFAQRRERLEKNLIY